MDLKVIPQPEVESPDEHSIYSPSGSKRWITCPASIQVIAGLNRPKGESNFFAEEGTAAHELGEQALKAQKPCEEFIGQTFNKFKVDKEMARQTQVYVDYVNGQVDWESVLWVENRLSLEHLQDGMFGTADAIVVSQNKLEIIDLKYGRGVVVEPDDNSQLMIYTLGVLKHLANHGIKFPDNFDVEMTIVQPRAPHDAGPVRSTFVTIAQLKDFQKIVINAIAETKKDNPSFGPTEDGCMWCEFAPICKAKAEHMLEVARLEFADFELPPKEFKSKLVEANAMPMEDAIKIMEHAKAIEHWVKSISGYMMERLKSEKNVKGYKLVRGRSNRAWVNVEKAMATLEDYGTDRKRLFTEKPLSPAQAEKELTEAEWEMISDLIFKPEGKITIAKESDGRPEVSMAQEAADDWASEEL